VPIAAALGDENVARGLLGLEPVLPEPPSDPPAAQLAAVQTKLAMLVDRLDSV
jgi:hypothetical protein